MFGSAGCFSFEGFSLMKALALEIRELQFLIKNNKVFCSAVKFFQFLAIKTLNPELDPQYEKMLDLVPH
jgi:hypothetical protein